MDSVAVLAGAGGDAADGLDAAVRLADLLIKAYGPWGSLGIVMAWVAGSLLWRVYQDHKREQEVYAVVQEKERTIQRMAKIERDLRVALFKAWGYSVDEIERLVIKADFDDPVSSRIALESERKQPPGESSGRKGW